MATILIRPLVLLKKFLYHGNVFNISQWYLLLLMKMSYLEKIFYYVTAKNRPTLVDPNVQLEAEVKENKYIISGTVLGGVMLGVLATVCCICYYCYKKKITRLVLDNPGKLLETYREQIRNESNSENYRTELINKANELAKDIINYRNERKQSTRIISGGNQVHASSNQEIEMSRRIEDDCPARGPPPSPYSNGSSDSPHMHQPHPATGNEDEVKVSQDSKASLVDEALEAFVRDVVTCSY